MLAIIGGRGLTQLANLKITHQQVMRTPYGEPSGAFMFGTLNQHEVIFLARHGYGHTIPPHLVNYRANLWALREQGASKVISVATVGGIRADLKPGVIVVPDQIIDYTHGRDATYFEARDKPFSNTDFTFPYSAALRSHILRSARTRPTSRVWTAAFMRPRKVRAWTASPRSTAMNATGPTWWA